MVLEVANLKYRPFQYTENYPREQIPIKDLLHSLFNHHPGVAFEEWWGNDKRDRLDPEHAMWVIRLSARHHNARITK